MTITSREIAALTGLIAELRPDLGQPLATSLVVEVFDRIDESTIGELDPQARWNAIRESAYPAARCSTRAVARSIAQAPGSYAARRATELVAAAPSESDFLGRGGATQ